MAAGDIVQTKSGTATSGTSIALTFDSTCTSGNDIVLLVGHGSDGITTPTGYTLVKTQEHLDNNQWAGIYRKKSNGTETGVTVNFAASEEGGVFMLEIEGMTTSPDDKTNGSYNATSQSSIDPGSTGTLSQANEIVLCIGWNWRGPSDDFTINDGFSHYEFDSGASFHALIGHVVVTATTAKDPTITFDGADSAWSIAAIASFVLDVAQDVEGSATLTGVGTITGTAEATHSGTVSAIGVGTLTAIGTVVAPPNTWPGYAEGYAPATDDGSASLIGYGTLAAAGGIVVTGRYGLEATFALDNIYYVADAKNILPANGAHGHQGAHAVPYSGQIAATQVTRKKVPDAYIGDWVTEIWFTNGDVSDADASEVVTGAFGGLGSVPAAGWYTCLVWYRFTPGYPTGVSLRVSHEGSFVGASDVALGGGVSDGGTGWKVAGLQTNVAAGDLVGQFVARIENVDGQTLTEDDRIQIGAIMLVAGQVPLTEPFVASWNIEGDLEVVVDVTLHSVETSRAFSRGLSAATGITHRLILTSIAAKQPYWEIETENDVVCSAYDGTDTGETGRFYWKGQWEKATGTVRLFEDGGLLKENVYAAQAGARAHWPDQFTCGGPSAPNATMHLHEVRDGFGGPAVASAVPVFNSDGLGAWLDRAGNEWSRSV